MIIVFKWANFTCCNKTCCAKTEICFGHASLFCTKAGFGLSVGHQSAYFDDRDTFLRLQGGKKFGKIERYASIPTFEDVGARLRTEGDGNTTAMLTGMNEGKMKSWWRELVDTNDAYKKLHPTSQDRPEKGRDCADTVFDALYVAGGSQTWCFRRRWDSAFLLTPDATVAYAAALAQAMCNVFTLDRPAYQGLRNDIGDLEGVNYFEGPE